MGNNIIELTSFEYKCRTIKDIELFKVYFKIIMESKLTIVSKVKNVLQLIKYTIKG
jgi:hypothetical protein